MSPRAETMVAMDVAKTIEPYFRAGRLTAVPRRRPARLAVLDFLAGQFEPGRQYSEREVDEMLLRFHEDYCALRRYMVDEELMERRDGTYWRAGGTFDLD
jgi:hypothetical protein